ncbi:hypothetical protein AXF42_Ash020775 [Apostasia shenzhenica]|uniref:Uncharacterized protein n=1 Tax=Apostasia shenzhenica TaxID=1088818 RepID=A0A2I0A4I1_9ASPA|nr:hypothetical protein AXF42_Ash020775 [Apostasia shenzhenica]
MGRAGAVSSRERLPPSGDLTLAVVAHSRYGGYSCQACTNCTVVSLEGFNSYGLGHMSVSMLLQDLIFGTKG